MRKLFLKSNIVTILIFINSIIGYSQPSTWYRVYGYPDITGEGRRVLQTFDGGFVALGYRETGETGKSGISETFLIKYDFLGNFLWVKLIGDSTGRMPSDFRQTKDSGFVITGHSFGAFLAKTDKNGNLQWEKNYQNLNPNTGSNCVAQTLDGGYIICGSYTDLVNPSEKGIVIKTDSLGIVQWEKQYMDSLFNYYGSIIQENNGYYYVYGGTQKIHPVVYWSVIKKLDSNGNIIWTKIFGVNIGGGNDIIRLNSGNLIVGSYRTDYYFPVLSKLDTSGNIIWYKEYPGYSRFYYTSKDFNNNIILTGGNDYLSSTITMMKFDTSGNFLKQRNLLYSGYNLIGGHCANYTSDSGYIITGVAAITTPYLDYGYLLIIKADSAFNAPPVVGINNISIQIPEKFQLLQNYPNPFNSSTRIRFSLPNNGNVNISIYNILGKKVFSIEKKYYMGLNEESIDFNNLSLCSGVYFFRIIFENKSKIIKAVYLK